VSVHISSSREPPRQPGTSWCCATSRNEAGRRRIRYLARFDTLTKMPNRMQFQHQLHQAITPTPAGTRIVLLYIDIDNFKEINDTSPRMATACSGPSASG